MSQNFFHSIDKVSDDNNLFDIRKLDCLVYSTSNNLALVEMIFVAWWIVSIIGKLWVWMYTIEVTILFLILASNIMMVELEFVKVLNITSLSFLIWDFLKLTLLLSECKKEKQLENKTTNLFPEENSRLNRSNNLKIPFNLLSVFTMGLLIFNFYFIVRFSIDSRWCSLLEKCLASSIELIIWLGRNK